MTVLNVGTDDTLAGCVAGLRARINGEVITPADAAYERSRQVFFGGIDRRPAVIVKVADAVDVSCAVTIAAEAGLTVAVRSGGHSTYGVWDDALVIDLSGMRALDIDPERRIASAEPGLTAAEYTTAAADHGLATGFGDTGPVGLGGLVVGGGLGYLVRRFGLTIDDLLAVEIVTADGSILRADATSHPDLFWAVRGGGGNFGIVTRYELRLHHVPEIYGGMLVLPATAEILTAYLEAAQQAPDELSSIVNIMPAPPVPFLPPERHGTMVMMAMLVHAGDPAAGPSAVAPFRELAEPFADMIRTMPMTGIYEPVDENYHPLTFSRTTFLDTIDHPTAEQILEFLGTSTAPTPVAQLRALGGAMARVPVDATAFAHRKRRFMATAAVVFEDPAEEAVHRAWVDGFGAALRARGGGAYVNFLYDDAAERIHEAYPAGTWARLAEIKRRYDPANVFHLNGNISPAE